MPLRPLRTPPDRPVSGVGDALAGGRGRREAGGPGAVGEFDLAEGRRSRQGGLEATQDGRRQEPALPRRPRAVRGALPAALVCPLIHRLGAIPGVRAPRGPRLPAPNTVAGMIPFDALADVHRPRLPEPVRILVLVLMAVAVLGVLSGLIAGFATLAMSLAQDAGGREVIVPAYTAVVLAIALWHNVLWVAARLLAAAAVARRLPVARIARVGAIAVEALAVAIWTAAMFTWVEDENGPFETGVLEALRGFAIACVIGSVAVIVLLCLPATRAWCRRE
jgi:hypothetical protein